MERNEPFIPGAGLHALTPAYDLLFRLTLPERALRDGLVERLALPDGARLLDLGCGTGALLACFARARPDLELAGVDIDPRMLAQARARLSRASATASLLEASAAAIPLPDQSVDAVVSVLVFHHLPPEVKRGATREIRRLLRPGGTVLIADFGRPQGRLQAALFAVASRVESRETTAGHADGIVETLLREQGFAVREERRLRTIFGTIGFYRGTP